MNSGKGNSVDKEIGSILYEAFSSLQVLNQMTSKRRKRVDLRFEVYLN